MKTFYLRLALVGGIVLFHYSFQFVQVGSRNLPVFVPAQFTPFNLILGLRADFSTYRYGQEQNAQIT